jgi:uncharacterized damage-inducible protein DinB
VDIDTIKLLAKYNRKTNEEMNEIVSSLSDQEWKKNFAGYYPSVLSVCNHLYVADFNWLKRFKNLREFDYTKTALFDSSYSFTSSMFDSISRYVEMRKELDDVFMRMSEEVSEDDFEETLKWKNFRGEDQERNFGGILLHVFNHQTHHRGMISLYLEFLGKKNDFSNLMFLV